jgi:hypothetical protein
MAGALMLFAADVATDYDHHAVAAMAAAPL